MNQATQPSISSAFFARLVRLANAPTDLVADLVELGRSESDALSIAIAQAEIDNAISLVGVGVTFGSAVDSWESALSSYDLGGLPGACDFVGTRVG